MAAPMLLFFRFLLYFCTSGLSYGISDKKAIYSTKTPYFWLSNTDESVTDDSETWADYEDKTCQVLHLNVVFRHGARYPTLKWINRMSDLHEKLIQSGVDEKFKFLKSWDNPFPKANERLLTELGEEEHFELGRRFGRRFKLMFEDDLDNLKFYVSSKQRTQSSADAFYEGLTDSLSVDAEEEMEPVVDDIALRFHDNCNEYTKSVEKNHSALSEYKKFKNGPEISEIAKTLSSLLGVEKITADEINTIYQLCAFELAQLGGSDWCQFLNDDNIPAIEYLSDLKQYWKKAYGFNISKDMACPLFGSMISNMDDVIKHNEQGNDFTVAIFQFGHAETLAPLYAAIGLFKDEQELMADNYNDHADRQFRSSEILPFSANLAIALYECDIDEDLEPEDEKEPFLYAIKMFVNEKPVTIPACGKTMCPFTKVREFYQRYVDKCDFNGLCKNHKKEKHDEL